MSHLLSYYGKDVPSSNAGPQKCIVDPAWSRWKDDISRDGFKAVHLIRFAEKIGEKITMFLILRTP